MLENLKKIKCGKVKYDIPLKNLTTYRLSGLASVVVIPTDLDELINILKFVRKNNIKYVILGNGSNVIFPSNYTGVVIKMDSFDSLEINDTIVKVGAGYNLMKLSYKMSREGFSGLEFAAGIPGTIGGAVYMNAGAYDSDMGYIVSEIEVLDDNYEIKKIYNKELNFHYRTSMLQSNKNYICLSATLVLKHGKKDVIMDIIEERKKRRLMSQPLEFPSAGSVFRNPEGDFAGRMIEYLGYKGKTYKGAEVSEKHANFIINRNEASGDDIKELIAKIKEDVNREFHVELKVEQEFIE